MAKRLAEKTRNWEERKRPTGLIDDLDNDDLYIESNPNPYEPTSYTTPSPAGNANYSADDDEISMIRRQISVILCAASIFFEGINLSLAGPFFPDQAIKKGKMLLCTGCFINRVRCNLSLKLISTPNMSSKLIFSYKKY